MKKLKEELEKLKVKDLFLILLLIRMRIKK